MDFLFLLLAVVVQGYTIGVNSIFTKSICFSHIPGVLYVALAIRFGEAIIGST